MWPSPNLPPVTTRSQAPLCHESPTPTRFFTSSPSTMEDVEGPAGHGSRQRVRPGSCAESDLNAPPGMHHAARDSVSTGSWLTGRGSGRGVRQVSYSESYVGALPGLHLATDEHEMTENWVTGVGFGTRVRQGLHADSYIGAPPGLHQATEQHEMTGNWLEGVGFGTGVRQGFHAGSHIGAPPGLHQATEENLMTENWFARHVSGKGIRQESYAESYFGAPPGLRHPAEEEWKENWLTHAGAVPPTPLIDASMLVTTLLIDKVNRRLSQEDVLHLLPCDRFNYDMLYLLFDLTTKRSAGRMFINFTTHRHAAEFQAQWHGKRDVVLSGIDERGDRKPLRIEAARRQGLEQNVGNWQRRLRKDVPVTYFPALFIGGNRIYFWEYRCGLSGLQ